MSSSILSTSPSFANFTDSIVASGLVPADELNLACAAAKQDPHNLAKLLSAKGLLRIGHYHSLDRHACVHNGAMSGHKVD